MSVTHALEKAAAEAEAARKAARARLVETQHLYRTAHSAAVAELRAIVDTPRMPTTTVAVLAFIEKRTAGARAARREAEDFDYIAERQALAAETALADAVAAAKSEEPISILRSDVSALQEEVGAVWALAVSRHSPQDAA